MPNVGDLLIGGSLPIASIALEGAHQLATKTGSISLITVLNYNATPRHVLFLDQLASPAAYSTQAVTPIWFYAVAGLASNLPGFFKIDFANAPIQFKNGLWVVMSSVNTTPFSCTTVAADMAMSALVNLG